MAAERAKGVKAVLLWWRPNTRGALDARIESPSSRARNAEHHIVA